MLKLECVRVFVFDVLRLSCVPDTIGMLSIYRNAIAENTGIMASCIR